jgi:lipoprotein NlpI
MTDKDVADYAISRAFSLKVAIEAYYRRQNIKPFAVTSLEDNNNWLVYIRRDIKPFVVVRVEDKNNWLMFGYIFDIEDDWIVVSPRAIISKLQHGGDPQNIVRYIKDDLNLNAILSKNDDIIAYYSTSKRRIDEILAICNGEMISPAVNNAPINKYHEEMKNEIRSREEIQMENNISLDEINQKGIAKFTEEIAVNPTDDRRYVMRGVLRLQCGNLKGAWDDFNNALWFNPKNDDAFECRGMVHIQRKDYDQAIADFTVAIRLNPKNIGAHQQRGAAFGVKGKEYHQRGDVGSAKIEFEKSINDYNSVLAIDPNNKETKLLLNNAMWVMNQII